MANIYTLEPGKLLRIEGPAAVRVLNGEVYVMGIVCGPESKFTVLRARKVIVKPRTVSRLEITLGPDGNVEIAKPEEEVIDLWEEKLSKLDLRGVSVILGAMDVGKTTLTVILANKAASMGLRVGIIDADLGQNDLGPPATVDAAILEPGQAVTHLRMLQPVKAVFLKTTSVERVWKEVVQGVKRLVDYLVENEKVSTVVINTDGWISTDKAIEYKVHLIETLQPRNVFLIKRADEADKLIEAVQSKFADKANIVVLPAPPAARIRSREDRRIHREMGYGKYLNPPRDLTLDLRKTPIVNFPLFCGFNIPRELRGYIRKLVGSNIIHCEIIGGCLVAVTLNSALREPEIRDMPGRGKLIVLPNGWERGILVGLENENNFLLALGKIRKIYYNAGKIVVTVSKQFVDSAKIHHIRLGMIRLNEQFEEVEKVNYIAKLESLVARKAGSAR